MGQQIAQQCGVRNGHPAAPGPRRELHHNGPQPHLVLSMGELEVLQHDWAAAPESAERQRVGRCPLWRGWCFLRWIHSSSRNEAFGSKASPSGIRDYEDMLPLPSNGLPASPSIIRLRPRIVAADPRSILASRPIPSATHDAGVPCVFSYIKPQALQFKGKLRRAVRPAPPAALTALG